MVFEILVAILSVCGVILLLWCVTGCFLRPFGGKVLKMLYPVSGDAQELEHAIRGILWLREVGLTSGSVYLLDVGLSETGGRIVQALCEKWEFVTLLPEERLSDLFKTGS